ncbi:MAG: HK97 family phage prohead protease [Treponema sp.]|jgi:HK97 family phage prohead protease|nr:HK97 family phage prohead protease [Treponema sp.]
MKPEKRITSLHKAEVRSLENGGKKYIEGLIPYNSKSLPMWGVTEIIDKGAFTRSLASAKPILALYNHNDSCVLGNTAAGTLALEDSDLGLLCRCTMPNTTYANDLFEIVARGDVKTMSFGFIPEKWEYSADGKQRTLKDVCLDEISFGVTFPAYPETTSETQVRATRRLMKRSIDVESINALLEKETLTEEDKTQIKELIGTLQGLIGKTDPPADPKTGDPDTRTDEQAEKEAEELALVETAIELEIFDAEELKEEVEEALKAEAQEEEQEEKE